MQYNKNLIYTQNSRVTVTNKNDQNKCSVSLGYRAKNMLGQLAAGFTAKYLAAIPSVTIFASSALASSLVVSLDNGASAFFEPVLKVITNYSSSAIFTGGVLGAMAHQGDLRVKFGLALVGMAVAGLVVVASQKMLGVTVPPLAPHR